VSTNKYQPLGERLLVEKYDDEEKSEGGIVLAEQTISSRPLKGKVFKKGDKCSEIISEEDEILFDRTVYPIIEINKKEYLLITQPNIIMII